MLEEVADYLVIAPLVAVVLVAGLAVGWSLRDRLSEVRVNTTKPGARISD
jgi:hypothetical protein